MANPIHQSIGITSKTKTTLQICIYGTAAWQVKATPIPLVSNAAQALISPVFTSLKMQNSLKPHHCNPAILRVKGTFLGSNEALDLDIKPTYKYLAFQSPKTPGWTEPRLRGIVCSATKRYAFSVLPTPTHTFK